MPARIAMMAILLNSKGLYFLPFSAVFAFSMFDEKMIFDYLTASNCEVVIIDTLSEKIDVPSIIKKINSFFGGV